MGVGHYLELWRAVEVRGRCRRFGETKKNQKKFVLPILVIIIYESGRLHTLHAPTTVKQNARNKMCTRDVLPVDLAANRRMRLYYIVTDSVTQIRIVLSTRGMQIVISTTRPVPLMISRQVVYSLCAETHRRI